MATKAIDKSYLLKQLKGYDEKVASKKYVGQEEGKSLIDADNLALIGTTATKVSTLVGDDADKSVRTIANEELAKQLIPEDAKESLDTLQEIAAWIQAHPDDASAMSADITALKGLVGETSVSSQITTAVGDLGNASEDTPYANVKEYVDAKVAEAQSAATTEFEDTDIDFDTEWTVVS
jgi:ABC-type nitrate/sulfonate/bicarbonate transport system substrate-binding protein